MFPLGLPTLLNLDTEFKSSRERKDFLYLERNTEREKAEECSRKRKKLKQKIATPEIEPRTVTFEGTHSTTMSPLTYSLYYESNLRFFVCFSDGSIDCQVRKADASFERELFQRFKASS